MFFGGELDNRADAVVVDPTDDSSDQPDSNADAGEAFNRLPLTSNRLPTPQVRVLLSTDAAEP